jgi:xanthine dehydrogenase YagR molybdenum-binding subunit
MTGMRDAAAVIVGQAVMPATGIGAAMKRPEGRAKVTGAARYAGEEMPPNTLHAVMVTSAIASGRVTGIAAESALALPGMIAVLTHVDYPKLKPAPVPPVSQSIVPMQSAEVHYEGQPIALVLAETLEAAEEAAGLVAITYQSEPHAAFESGEERVPRQQGNGYAFAAIDAAKGDAEAALAGASTIIDQIYITPTRHHNMMEPSATLAEWRGDALFIHDATQWTYGIRYALSALLAMPPDKIHVRCPYTGGGFGAKGYVWPHQILAPLAARLVGRPVKLAIGRAGCYSGTGYQPIVRSRVRLAANRDGRLAAVAHDTANVTSQFDDYVEFGSAGTRSLYATPALSTHTRIVKAHVGTPTAMRAPHEGPGMFALESAMDELAYALGMDPLELRLRNYADRDPLSGKPFSSNRLREAYAEGARRFGWSKRLPGTRSMRDGGKLIGWGIAAGIMSTFRFASNARIRLAADGKVTIEAGCQEIGTGAYTVMPQIAAEVLSIPSDRITLHLGDTCLPETGGTFGSSTTMSTGSAVADAAEKLNARLAGLSDRNQPPPADEWGALLREKGIGELVEEGSFGLPGGVGFDAHGGASGFSMHTWGAIFVEMEVDEELGLARMRRCVAGYSAGRILNPRTARSQMIGGIIWGYGRAMLEESAIDPRYGRYLSKNLSGVMLPVNADIPPDIDVFFIDEHDPHASKLGARGIGELGEVGVAAAITNAIYHATGKRIRKLPVHIGDLVAS